MQQVLKKLVFFVLFFITGTSFSIVPDQYFRETISQTTSSIPYSPKQSLAPIKADNGQSGCVSIEITPNGLNFQCELKYLSPDSAGKLTVAQTKIFSNCSDAAVVTTNINNFYNGSAAKTYLITANYETKLLNIYRVTLNKNGLLEFSLSKQASASIYHLPPNLTGTDAEVGVIATYLEAVADPDKDQLGFLYPSIDLETEINHLTIGLREAGANWKVTNSNSFFTENYSLLLSDEKFQIALVTIEDTTSRNLYFYDIVNQVLSNTPITIALKTYPKGPLYTRHNTIEALTINSDIYIIYKDPLDNALVYKLKNGSAPSALFLSSSNARSIDTSRFGNKIELGTAHNSNYGANAVITAYENTNTSFSSSASASFDSSASSNFSVNLATFLKYKIGNLGKGILAWTQNALTNNQDPVAILGYIFVKSNNSQIIPISDPIYSTPVGINTASNQLNELNTQAAKIPTRALDSNAEIVDLDVITLPGKPGTNPTFIIKLITYLYGTKSFSIELLSGNLSGGLGSYDTLIKLVDTYSPIKAKGSM